MTRDELISRLDSAAKSHDWQSVVTLSAALAKLDGQPTAPPAPTRIPCPHCHDAHTATNGDHCPCVSGTVIEAQEVEPTGIIRWRTYTVLGSIGRDGNPVIKSGMPALLCREFFGVGSRLIGQERILGLREIRLPS